MLNQSSEINHKSGNYIERNLPWLIPAIGTLVLLAAPILLELTGTASPLPHWLPLVGAIIGSFLTGLGSIFVDTFSAKVIQYLAFALGLGGAVIVVLMM
uniref:hypothetical protein n=1 Tax=Acidovorax sp. SUPP3334 TaxID=2920881 RepID=UPI002952950A|nr:hypothetical protein [Acidovorax sp. SUPP3334]BDH38335.1 hypothetical protein AVHM3334_23050 [Acidovorax sp. SUPP3334]